MRSRHPGTCSSGRCCCGKKQIHVSELKIVRLVRRLTPVSADYEGTRFSVRKDGRRFLTPFALVVIVLLFTVVVFAVDSVPAVYGITGDPYLVFATDAFALLGLRALYFLLEGALPKLVHLSYGLSFILAFIGVKLLLHWAHDIWTWVPEIPTLGSLLVIVGGRTPVVTTCRRRRRGTPWTPRTSGAPENPALDARAPRLREGRGARACSWCWCW